MKLSIAEIISGVVSLPTVQEKVDFLLKHKSVTLELILKYTYDPKIEFLVPNTRPPWTKNGLVDVHGRLYAETRRLSIFLKGGKYDGKLKSVQIERLFIELLEGVDDKDAEILANMIEKKPIVGLDLETIILAFPQILT